MFEYLNKGKTPNEAKMFQMLLKMTIQIFILRDGIHYNQTFHLNKWDMRKIMQLFRQIQKSKYFN